MSSTHQSMKSWVIRSSLATLLLAGTVISPQAGEARGLDDAQLLQLQQSLEDEHENYIGANEYAAVASQSKQFVESYREQQRIAEEERRKAAEAKRKAEEEKRKAEEAKRKAELAEQERKSAVAASSEQQSGNSDTQEEQGFNYDKLIADAMELRGTRYRWGGTTPAGFDCSGFLNYVFGLHNISLPRDTLSLWNGGTAVSQPKPGDIVLFRTYRSTASHAGIYVGNNRFIHASTSNGVIVSSMSESYWAPRYLGARRYIQ